MGGGKKITKGGKVDVKGDKQSIWLTSERLLAPSNGGCG